MNWPVIFRKLCEAYFKTPAELENLTLGQLFIMAMDVDALRFASHVVKGSPEKLYARGLLKKRPYPGGMSLAARIKAGLEGGDTRQAKRARRAARRQALIQHKQQGL